MSWFARLMYRALVWKEHQRAQRAHGQTNENPRLAAHLQTVARSEMLAYWYLRQAGYTIVARNQRAPSGEAEPDLVGWDGPVLAFVEVRTSNEAGLSQAAPSRGKQARITKAAKKYLRRLNPRPMHYRFDVVRVSWDSEAGYRVRLVKDAFRAS